MTTIKYLLPIVGLCIVYMAYTLIIFLLNNMTLVDKLKMFYLGSLVFSPGLAIFNYFLLTYNSIRPWIKFVIHVGGLMINIGCMGILIYLLDNDYFQDLNAMVSITVLSISSIILSAILSFDVQKYRSWHNVPINYSDIYV